MYLLCACVCASIGAVSDWRTRRMPNLLTGSSMLSGLLLHLAWGGWRAAGLAAAAGLLCGAGFFIFFLVGGMGAGDVKMMAAVGCMAGFGRLSEMFLATVLIGGVFAVALAMLRGQLKRTIWNVGALILHHGRYGLVQHPELNLLNADTLRLPYGMAIAAGCWLTLARQSFVR
ncbi:MAG TPA: prepilin peptidase [Acidobacteriaceae bacterium]|nr:prepilin peptidase [Acidobacteriaceae bacterium]